ncbi:fimbrial protein, partial [Escherichia coli]|uniref:fimbrial protein n=2 Tax=Escherichia coli TaxID=562 RepID=UPI0020239600
MKRLHKRFLLATFCALFTATLQAADVTITVNGRVVAKPCTIQTKEANVNLGDLYTRNLQQPGSASGWHNITLSLTDCLNRPGFPGECFICELRLPDHRFRWKHNKLFL